MKPHIVIPLLVVCVGLPLVALGTYSVCDNFPVAEEMRKREVQYKEDMRREAEMIKEERRLEREQAEEKRLMARRNAEEEERPAKFEVAKREDERIERTGREPTPQSPSTGGGLANQAPRGELPVTIRGVSVNLPYNEFKQKMTEKFGKPPHESIHKDNSIDFIPSFKRIIVEGNAGMVNYMKKMNYSDVDEEYGKEYGKKAINDMRDEVRAEYKDFVKALKLDWPGQKKTDLWGDALAYGGDLQTSPDPGVSGVYYVEFFSLGDWGDFSKHEENSRKYYEALCKKYGTAEKLFSGVGGMMVNDRTFTIYAITGEDGLILILEYKPKGAHEFYFFYLDQSFLNRYKSYILQKRERDKKREAQLQELRRRAKQAMEQEKESVKKRDSEI